MMTLYAIVGARPARGLGKGLAGGALSVVSAAGAFVVVERAPASEAGVEAMRAYDRIVRRIARASPAVLPFRFGSAVPDARALATSLAPVRPAIARALAKVEGCVQFTLRVFGEAAPLPAPARRRGGPGTRWLDARMAARRVSEIAPVTASTTPFVRAAKSLRHDRAPLLASVYHLVSRADARRYRAALAAASRALVAVRVEATGPWPPYAFAELE
ncbi:MAG: GvpL/GvpF family gas vesicle protein [Deltaproteobacteria bacterium]|nr:GvpL/GvpF family gas vesicle protein [Deltaproteobacteria bacterium]